MLCLCVIQLDSIECYVYSEFKSNSISLLLGLGLNISSMIFHSVEQEALMSRQTSDETALRAVGLVHVELL